jgi:hypothetical protein
MAAQCFDGLIGITRKVDCPCYDSEITSSYKSSKYGLFLDELNGGITLDSIRSVGECGGTLLDYFKNAIEQAKSFFKADLLADLAMRYKTAIDPFTGNVGSRGFARTRLMGAEQNMGVRLDVKPKIGAYFTINKINLYLDQTLTGIKLDVYKRKYVPGDGEYTMEVVKSFTNLASTANQEKENVLLTADVLQLPLFDLEGSDFQYYAVIDRTTAPGANPKDNANRCNCGRSEMRMLQYFNPVGVQGDISDAASMQVTTFVNGVVLYGSASCGTDDVICDAMDINEAVAFITAYAQWYKAGSILIDKILASQEVNKYTMSNREFLYGKRNNFEKEYFSRIRWIGENMSVKGTDCFECDEDKGISLGGIIS